MKLVQGLRNQAPPTSSYPADAIFAASANLVDVQAAVDACLEGGTVVVPAGDVTWAQATTPRGVGADNSLYIDFKAIRLIGAGCTGPVAGRTIIRHDGVGSHRLIHMYPDPGNSFAEITGFDFRGTLDYAYSTGTCIFLITDQTSPPWNNLRIHHNAFTDFDIWGLYIYTNSNALIDHNTFTGNQHGGIQFLGYGGVEWGEPQNLGTVNWTFVEDNVFNWRSGYNFENATKTPCDDIYEGGRIVWRYNDITNGFFQTHDFARAGLGHSSAAHWDINNNTFTCNNVSNAQWKAIDLSAGTGVCWNNSINGQFYYPISVIELRSDTNQTGPTSFRPSMPSCDGTYSGDGPLVPSRGYICKQQFGSLQPGGVSASVPAYFWGNTFTGPTPGGSASYWPGGVADGTKVSIYYTDSSGLTNLHIQSGREYIEGVAKPGYTPYTYPHPRQSQGYQWT